MGKLACVALILALAACGGAQPEPQTAAEDRASPTSTVAGTQTASPAGATSGPDPSPASRFVRVLGMMDCPGGCPSSA